MYSLQQSPQRVRAAYLTDEKATMTHYDAMTWNPFPHDWPFVRGNNRSSHLYDVTAMRHVSILPNFNTQIHQPHISYDSCTLIFNPAAITEMPNMTTRLWPHRANLLTTPFMLVPQGDMRSLFLFIRWHDNWYNWHFSSYVPLRLFDETSG